MQIQSREVETGKLFSTISQLFPKPIIVNSQIWAQVYEHTVLASSKIMFLFSISLVYKLVAFTNCLISHYSLTFKKIT